MSMLQGKVKYETLEVLFSYHFPKPSEVEKRLIGLINEHLLEAKSKLEAEYSLNMSKWKSLPFYKRLNQKEPSLKFPKGFYQYPVNTKSLRDFVLSYDKMIGGIDAEDLFWEIQDLRAVFNVKTVAKNSQSNFVLADKGTLLSVERVASDPEYYENLLDF